MATSFKILPQNYLKDWGEFESWAAGANSAPDGWIVATVPFKTSQETTNIKFGLSSALIIGSSGGIGGIYRTVPMGTNYAGRTFKLGVWGKSSSTGPYIEIHDGVSSVTAHLDGLNAFSFVTTPKIKLDYSNTQFKISLFATQNATAYFDGAVLCEGEDLFTSLDDQNIAISDWKPSINFKQDQYEIAQREGSFIPDNHIQGKSIRVGGTVTGSDTTSCRTNFDNMIKSLVDLQTTQMRHLYLYDDRVLDVYLKSFDWGYKNNLKFINFNLNFSAPDATTRSINRYRTRTVTSGTATDFTITYNGNAESKPIVSFIANQGSTISTCTLENLTTGEALSYVGTVPINVALDVDCDLGTIFNSSVDSINNFSGDFLRLVRGTNNFKFTGNPCLINVDYYEKYL